MISSSKTKLCFRNNVLESDISKVKDIVSSSNFFYKYEINYVVDLISKSVNNKTNNTFVFAECDNGLVGFVGINEIECALNCFEISWISVHNNFRGLGIGTMLLSKIKLIAKDLSARLIIAETSGIKKYYPTRMFYEKNNFLKEAIIKDFYLEGDDKYIYVCRFK